MQPIQLISIQHELAMAISLDYHLEPMLQKFSKTCSRRLGLSGITWYLKPRIFDSGTIRPNHDDTPELYLSVPKSERFARTIPNDQRAYWESEGRHAHRLELTDIGYCVLWRDTKAIEATVIAALAPIAERLSRGIVAIAEHEALINANNMLTETRARLEFQLHHDDLTGALNRTGLVRDLKTTLKLATGESEEAFGSILFLDLDRFKWVNDSFGHHIGDQLLLAVTQLLRLVADEQDTIARLSGDEFVMLLGPIWNSEALAAARGLQLGTRINERFNMPMQVGKHQFQISASIGVKTYQCGKDTATGVLRDADIAMYQSKRHRKNRTVLFREDMATDLNDRLLMERELRNTISAGEGFTMRYQGQQNAKGQLVGAEALVRWQHPTKGELLPKEFITMAEEVGLMWELGSWIVKQSLYDIGYALETGVPKHFKRVSINISPLQIEQRNFVPWLKECLEKFAVPAERICLELTEQGFVRQIEHISKTIRELNALGVEVAIDDFGKGYSSLAYLQEFPVSVVKIDKNFIRGVDTDNRARKLSQNILNLCHTLGLKATAEGVETLGEMAILQAQGFDQFQGFLFSKPEPLDELIARYRD